MSAHSVGIRIALIANLLFIGLASLVLPASAGVMEEYAVPGPLAPVSQSSPRQTLASFRALSQEAEDALLKAIQIAAQNDAILDTPEVRALKQKAIDDLYRAASTLDLSKIPPASRRTVGLSSVLLLKEITDRIPLPDPRDIPDEAGVRAGLAAVGWTLPGTEIRMVRMSAPDGEPRFMFSADTVGRLSEFYSRTRHLPRNADSQIDFYESFVLGPGLEMPVEFYRYILELPHWLRVEYNEQAVWQWMGFAVLTVIALGLVFLLLRRELRRPQDVSAVSRSFKRIVTPLAIIALLSGYRWLNDNLVNLTGDVLAGLELAVLVCQAIAFSAVIILMFNTLASLVIAVPSMRKESLDASLIRLALRVVGILVAGYVLSLTAAEIGIPLYGIIASLGVGGLALALAVRPTLENFIGGIILYADRPVRVGDFCKFGSMLGTVEAIGLRSTKVRGLDRTLITVQNAEFSQMSITNFSRRDSNLMQTEIALRYETTNEQLAAIIAAIDAMLRADEDIEPDTVRVCLKELGAYSLDVEVRGQVRCADWTRFLKIKEAILLRIVAIVEEQGAAFAFPSQTTYLGTDTLADAQVESLRQLAEAGKGGDQALAAAR